MRNINRLYQKALRKYPVSTQAVQAGILMGLGDQIAQNFIDDSKNIDFVRTMQFAGIGFFITGPATRTWYGILDKYIGSKGSSVAIKKVACDQLFFAPSFIAVLLVAIGICQEKDIAKLKVKIANEYRDILINNYKLWPMVQLLNFSIVPLNYQALVVQSVALLWNSYISYRTSLDKHNEFK
ncbi:protein Mpv17 isoform X1 [Pogonomyrmex barbatus]|uniref:Mitochondrial inner membrane protein Mpv17 n=2 Tax=Pogonomyrmex barbatus TaxID=144034 RepID=A0A6I9VVM5_9HYME|nr:protein Mpv17 isoform X1 [Pogonomyrmex barbatus]XP_011629800.1 protein Mpv17 isoform X1 [Pogonomyrmex barbatus]